MALQRSSHLVGRASKNGKKPKVGEAYVGSGQLLKEQGTGEEKGKVVPFWLNSRQNLAERHGGSVLTMQGQHIQFPDRKGTLSH